jgi:uncharacterized membrane protein
MLPDPLHPAIVHFPVVLAVFAPLLAALALWAIQTGRTSRWTWIGIVVLQILVVGSGWIAMETGENEEDRVERVVAERHIEEHEEAAERFLTLAALALPLAAAGLLAGRLGTINRGLTLALTLAALAAAADTGHKGGELVYRHGAASAYTTTGPSPTGSTVPAPDRGRAHDDD